MARKNISLTPRQKDEVRRLTQLANRRIKAAERAYRREGMVVLPQDVVGHYQIKERWHTPSTPISRSVRFESVQDYRRHLRFLRSFEHMRPGIQEYTRVQREKTLEAVETSLGIDVPGDMQERINKMTAPELARFWNDFSDRASRMGMRYSSQAVMEATLSEYFPEDLDHLGQGA